MELTVYDRVFQCYEGFVVGRGNKTYYTDDNFNTLIEYDFQTLNCTLNGYVLNRNSEIMNILTGEIRREPDIRMSFLRELYKGNEKYDFENNVFTQKLEISCEGNNVVFSYGIPYRSNLENNFISYIYKNNKSILGYEDRIEVYDGELYSKERLKNLLDNQIEDDIDYASLTGIFYFNEPSLEAKILPYHIIYTDKILDLEKVDFYSIGVSADEILGIVNDEIITVTGRTNYKRYYRKIPNVYNL